ncbi:MAG: MBL fold metallo-hydrolase [Actinomycetota bacterium]
MEVTVLGSAAMYATTERACAGYLVELGTCRLWVDCGAGTWRNLLAHTDYRRLGGIVLTHRHPDHVSDVFQAFHARQFGGTDPMATIPVWAPRETIERVTGYYRELDEGFEMNAVAEGDSVDVAGARVSFVRMAHPPETLGVRIENEGKVLAYSADSGPEADFPALAGDADLFVCEATMQDSDPLWEGHLSASQAGAIAARVGASRLVLTHLPADRDLDVSLKEARATCPDVPVELAHDGLRLEV